MGLDVFPGRLRIGAAQQGVRLVLHLAQVTGQVQRLVLHLGELVGLSVQDRLHGLGRRHASGVRGGPHAPQDVLKGLFAIAALRIVARIEPEGRGRVWR